MSFKNRIAANCGYAVIFMACMNVQYAHAQNRTELSNNKISYGQIIANFNNLPISEQLNSLAQAQEESVKIAGFRPNPEIGIGVENLLGSSPYKGFDAVETTVQISQDLQLFGRKDANINLAKSYANSSKLEIEVKKQEYIKDVAHAWLAVENAILLLKLADEKLSLAKDDLYVVALLVQGGREPLLRKLQAEADLSKAETNKSQAENNVKQAINELKAISQFGGNIDNIKPEFIDKNPTIQGFDINSNANYRLLVSLSSANKSAIELAKVENKPNASAYVGARHLANDNALAFVGGVSFSVPLGAKNSAILAKKNAELRASDYAIDNFIRLAEGQRLVAISKINSANKAITNYGAVINDNEKVYELTKIGFKAGKLNLLEVQSARNALFDAKEGLLQNKFARANSEIEIAFIEGRLPFGVSK